MLMAFHFPDNVLAALKVSGQDVPVQAEPVFQSRRNDRQAFQVIFEQQNGVFPGKGVIQRGFKPTGFFFGKIRHIPLRLPLDQTLAVFFREALRLYLEQIEKRGKCIDSGIGSNGRQIVPDLSDQPPHIVQRFMFAEIGVHHKQDIVDDPHLFDHGKEFDIRLPHPDPAADHIYDQMGQHQIILDHGQVKRIGGITALAVRNFDVFGQSVGRIDFQLHIFKVDGQRIVTDKGGVQFEIVIFENRLAIFRGDDVPHPIVTFQVGGQQHRIGIQAPVSDQKFGIHIGQCLFQVPPVLGSADIVVRPFRRTAG